MRVVDKIPSKSTIDTVIVVATATNIILYLPIVVRLVAMCTIIRIRREYPLCITGYEANTERRICIYASSIFDHVDATWRVFRAAIGDFFPHPNSYHIQRQRIKNELSTHKQRPDVYIYFFVTK